MELNAIVESIYRDRRVNELLSKLQPEDLRCDLLHHCIIYLYKTAEKHPGKIEGLYERNELFAWFQQCMKMELMGANSAFRRKYRIDNDTEEVLMTNERISKLVDSQTATAYQREQDAEAIDKFGAGFIDYFYGTFHKRLDPKIKTDHPEQLGFFC